VLLRALGLVATICVLLLAAGCGDDDDDGGGGGGNGGGGGGESQETVRLGFIMEARPADQPWSAAIHDAGVKLQESDPDTEVTETFEAYDPTAAEPVARQLLDEGYGVLVLHSFALNDVAHTLAEEYSDVPMSVSSFDPPVQPNLSIATASYLQIGYSNCWLLARLSESGTIGIVGAQPIPYATELERGCKLGAKAADPEIEVLAAYGGDFADQQPTLEQSRNIVNRGADGLFPSSATEDSLGGFQVCEQEEINCAGWAANATQYAPNTAVTSAIVSWDVLLENLVDQARSGNLKATTFDATFGNDGLTTPGFEGAAAERVPDDVQQEYTDLIEQLTNDEVQLPKSRAHPCCP
jgi:basic membrane protein A and related proteins